MFNTHSDNLAEANVESNEGILVANVQCPPQAGFLNIFETGEDSDSFFSYVDRSALIFCLSKERELKTIKMTAGSYFFGDIGGPSNMAHIDEKNAYKFHIKANTLNYIGDIKVGATPHRRIGTAMVSHVGMIITDQNAQNKEEMLKSYPDLMRKYPYLVAVAAK